MLWNECIIQLYFSMTVQGIIHSNSGFQSKESLNTVEQKKWTWTDGLDSQQASSSRRSVNSREEKGTIDIIFIIIQVCFGCITLNALGWFLIWKMCVCLPHSNLHLCSSCVPNLNMQLTTFSPQLDSPVSTKLQICIHIIGLILLNYTRRHHLKPYQSFQLNNIRGTSCQDRQCHFMELNCINPESRASRRKPH